MTSSNSTTKAEASAQVNVNPEIQQPQLPLRRASRLGSVKPSRSVIRLRSVRPRIIGLKTKKED